VHRLEEGGIAVAPWFGSGARRCGKGGRRSAAETGRAGGESKVRNMSRREHRVTYGGKPNRLMSVWTAAHDNGWTASVVENPDGSFAAWAAPEGGSAGVYTIRQDVAEAKAAAEAALRRLAGHTSCAACGDWQQRTYAVFDRRTRAGSRAAVRAAVDARRAGSRVA
jgi:hypothetical protein